MALPLYLAMTAGEMLGDFPLPRHLGYMACHFSPAGTGLSNVPQALPPGAMLLVDDWQGWNGHDRGQIIRELADTVDALQCGSVLLDFQRPGIVEVGTLAREVVRTLPCPVGVSEIYGKDLDCPIFLPPVPLDVPAAEYLVFWKGREIWLEAALDGTTLTLSPQGCSRSPLDVFPQEGFCDPALHCHYQVETDENAHFSLWRSREDLDALLQEAEKWGVTRAVGLWQELNCLESSLS